MSDLNAFLKQYLKDLEQAHDRAHVMVDNLYPVGMRVRVLVIRTRTWRPGTVLSSSISASLPVGGTRIRALINVKLDNCATPRARIQQVSPEMLEPL